MISVFCLQFRVPGFCVDFHFCIIFEGLFENWCRSLVSLMHLRESTNVYSPLGRHLR